MPTPPLRSELAPPPVATFVNGLFAGLALAVVLAHAWLAVLLAPLRQTFVELAGENIGAVPCLSRLVVHPAWLWGVTAGGATLVLALIAKRPVRRAPYLATALLLLCTVTATWVLSQTPLTQLAGNIKSDAEMQLVPVGP